MNKKEFEKFEAMSIDDMLKLKGTERIPLREYNAYKEELRQEKLIKYKESIKPLLGELNRNNIDAKSVQEITDQQLNKNAIEILLRHLNKGYTVDVKRTII